MNHHDLIAAPLPKVGSQTPPNGRGTKFTPEKIQQIMNLVEREKSREEIAELVGVTVGSLQAHLFQAWDQPATTQIRQRSPFATARQACSRQSTDHA